MFRARAVLFDLDGTLVDSVPDIALAVAKLMQALELPERSVAQVRTWVGNGSEKLLHRALTNDMHGQAAPELLAQAKPLYRQFYGETVCLHSQLYPTVADTLAQLAAQGLTLACVTNKPAALAAPLLEQIGIAPYFATLVGGECTPAVKPAPDALLLAAERLAVAIEDCLMVGDSRNDVGAARNAGCPVVCVPYGYNHGLDIRQAEPDAVIEQLAELPALLHPFERDSNPDFRWRR